MGWKVVKQDVTGNIFVDIYRVKNEQCVGRRYKLKGLYIFLNSRDAPKGLEIPALVRQDLVAYEEYREDSKKRFGEKHKRNKLEKKTE